MPPHDAKHSYIAKSSQTKSATRRKSGCYTCRIRRKKCDEIRNEDGHCQTCLRLRLECLGFGAHRPDFLKVSRNVTETRRKIKSFLASQGMIKGHAGSGFRNLERDPDVLRLGKEYTTKEYSKVEAPPPVPIRAPIRAPSLVPDEEDSSSDSTTCSPSPTVSEDFNLPPPHVFPLSNVRNEPLVRPLVDPSHIIVHSQTKELSTDSISNPIRDDHVAGSSLSRSPTSISPCTSEENRSVHPGFFAHQGASTPLDCSPPEKRLASDLDS